ncbi:MAG TPA: hypothetical protein VMH04_02965 [Candidatus Solibacter sp.]|nr:hypothetical protein [Candidatus Solibacter sp.]
MARSASVLAAVETEERWDLQVAASSMSIPVSDVKEVVKSEEGALLSWTPDGKLITDHDNRVDVADPETGTRAIFGNDPGTPEFHPQSCRDGRVVFTGYTPASKQLNIFSLDVSGQNRKKLTNGSLDYYGQCSPDLQWVYYRDQSTNLLMRAPLDGGAGQQISDLQVQGRFDISPEGSVALFYTLSHTEGHKEKVLEVSVDNGQVKREIPMQKQHAGRIQYSLDGKALEYVVRENGVDNIWRQPLDGSAGKWETAFKSEHIGQFRWSPDGKQLAIVRGHTDSDVVLMRSTQ